MADDTTMAEALRCLADISAVDREGAIDKTIGESAPGAIARTMLRWATQQLCGGADVALGCTTIRELCTEIVEHEGVARAGPSPVVSLRPVTPDDTPQLYEAAQDPQSAFRWRYPAALPNPASFFDSIHQGVLCQFIVEDALSKEPQGLVVAYDHLLTHGHCWIAFQRIGQRARGGEMIFGMINLVEYVFTRWNFHAVWAEMPEYNFTALGSLGEVYREVGRIPHFFWYDRCRWDRIFLRIRRTDWEPQMRTWSEFLEVGY